jgi:hypothetical protein
MKIKWFNLIKGGIIASLSMFLTLLFGMLTFGRLYIGQFNTELASVIRALPYGMFSLLIPSFFIGTVISFIIEIFLTSEPVR